MAVPSTIQQVPEDGINEHYQIKRYGRSELGIEIRWFHPQTGELMHAATYDVRTGQRIPEELVESTSSR